MRRRNGFTLVELLVTIALMLTILAIAIVSFITVSNRKKEEAYQLVKEQILTAARQYFTANEYLYEGLSDGAKGSISLGKLVSEGYLNKVVDPRTGKDMSSCTITNVERRNGQWKATLDESTISSTETKCDSDNLIVIFEPGGPGIRISQNGNKGNNGWYTSSVRVNVTGETNNNGAIEQLSGCVSNGDYACDNFDFITKESSYVDDESFLNDTSSKMACYEVKNVHGKVARACTSAKVDRTKPSCSISTASSADGTNGWFKKSEVDLKITNLSEDVKSWGWRTSNNTPSNVEWDSTAKYSYGNCPNGTCTRSNISDLYISSEGKRYAEVYMTDEAGNKGTCITNEIKIDRTAPTCTIAAEETANGTNGWHKRTTVNLNLTKSSDVTSWNVMTSNNTVNQVGTWVNNGQTLSVTGEGYHYAKVNLTDQAGNTGSCQSSVIKMDVTPPKIIQTGHGKTFCKNSAGSTMNYGFSIKFQDNLSYTTVKYKYYSCNTTYSSLVTVGGTYPPEYTIVSGVKTKRDQTIKTNFVSCASNALGFVYYLYDEAGNQTTAPEIKVAADKSRYKTGATKTCNTGQWFNGANNSW